MIRYQRKAYTLSDQKSVLAPAKRHTGGLNGAFSFLCSSHLPDLQSECAAPGWICFQCVLVEVRARLCIVAIDVPNQDRLRQASAIAALPSTGFSGRRTPSFAFVRHEAVEVFSNLNMSTICFIGSARHTDSLAKCAWTQSRVSTTSYRV